MKSIKISLKEKAKMLDIKNYLNKKINEKQLDNSITQ